MKGIAAASLAFILWSTTIVAAPVKRDGKIGFDCDVPRHSNKLPLYSLGNPSKFPDDKLEDILKSALPGIKLTEKNVEGSRYFYDGDRLAGYYDHGAGETTVFPKLGLLKPGTKFKAGDIDNFERNDQIIPDDDTKHSIVTGSSLGGSQKTVNGKATPPATYLLESLIQREIDYEGQLHPVCGPGTKASFSFGADGSVKALSHKWRSAKSQESDITPLSQDTIQQTITAQLSAANINTNVTVKAIELCFFDSGNKFIQPVFRYNATVSHPFGLADDLVVGYIPAGGKEQEPLPSLNPPSDQILPTFTRTNDTTATNSTVITRSALPKRQGITVGRYAMSHDQYSPQIVVDENAFWNGLSSVSGSFVNSQYYWDEPFIYESDASYFVDAVNIAFTEGHGNVHYFTTNELEPSWGGISIADSLPSNGYGPGAGGSLAYWIIRACETISTPIDYSAADFDKAFDPWWTVFNGMHAVMGYRTNAAVYDNEMGNVGKILGMGASAVHGWMSAALGGGKTSAVTVCGHDDDTIYNIGNVGRPGCLQIWWYS